MATEENKDERGPYAASNIRRFYSDQELRSIKKRQNSILAIKKTKKQ